MHELYYKMKIKDETVDAIADLKGFAFDLTDAKEAHHYDKVVKKIGECVGQMCGLVKLSWRNHHVLLEIMWVKGHME